MHPIIFHIGSISIFSFGLMLAVAIISSSLLIAFLTRIAHVPIRGIFDNILFILFSGVIGARIGYVLAYTHYFRSPEGSWTSIFALWQGGLLFYGAVIGGLIAIWFSFRGDKKALWRWLDILAIGFLLGTVFSQIGCLLGGCGIGIASKAQIALEGHLPTQLFDAAWALVLLVVGLVLYLKRHSWRRGGYLFFASMILYFLGRAIIDYWRISPYVWHKIPAPVLVDVAFVAFLVVLMIIKSRRSPSQLDSAE